MFRLCLFISAVIFSANLYAQQATPSPAVRRILEKAVTEVKENRQVFDKSNEKPLGDALADLTELSMNLIQQGKNVDATAVLKQIETLDADVMKMANAPEPVPAPRPAPQKPLLERMAGKWTHPNSGHIYYFAADGLFRENRKNDGGVHSQGRLVLVSPDVAEVALSNNHRLQVRLAGPDMLAVLVWGPAGKPVNQGIVLERMR